MSPYCYTYMLNNYAKNKTLFLLYIHTVKFMQNVFHNIF